MKKYIALIAVLVYSNLISAQRLDNFYKIAAERNPGLKALYKEYESALQKIPQVRSLPDPTLTFGYFISSVETRVGPQQARFSLVQMFPWFGTLKAQGDAVALMAQVKFQNFIDARNKLFFQVASAYYPLYELREWIQIEEDNISVLNSYKSIANQSFKSGRGAMVDVLKVDIMLKEATTNLSILKDKERPLRTTFNKLLNREENNLVNIIDTLYSDILKDNHTVDSMLAVNPKLKSLDLKLKSLEVEKIVAQKQGFPKIAIGLDYVIVGERKDISIPDNGKNVFMPMVSINIPIFRAKYNAAVKEAHLMQESYTYQKQEVANMLISEYETALFMAQQQYKLLELYGNQIKTIQQSLNLLLTSYSNSGKEFDEVLQMQLQLLKYRKMRVSSLVQYQISMEKINYLTSKTY